MALISDSWIFDFIIGAIVFLIFLLHRTYSYWDRKGFRTASNISYLFGHFKRSFLMQESFAEIVEKLYRSTNEPFIGIYTILQPVLLIRDPELIRSVLVKDFQHFTDRGIYINEDNDPLSASLIALQGHKWKNFRAKLTPAFSSGKLKAIFSTLIGCGSTLQNYLDKLADSGELLDVHEISASFNTNVIASVGFGIDVDSITDPNNEFRVCSRQIFEPTLRNLIFDFLSFYAPRILNFLCLKSVPSEVETFLNSVVKQNLEYREKHNVIRKDFFQMLIQLRNNGTVQLDDQWETVIKADENQKTMTFNEIVAQSYIFIAAGSETSSTTLTFCMFELAKNPKIQEKVHNEIISAVERHGGETTYECVSQMKYLENCIDETLRLYSVVPILPRRCCKPYQIPNTNHVIEENVLVFVPSFSLQRDEKYYENPLKFDPDRFDEINSRGKNQINRPYLPFGDGSRNCMGIRLGKMQIKVGLVLMLQKFKFDLEDKSKNRELVIDPKSLLLSPFGGLKLKIFKR